MTGYAGTEPMPICQNAFIVELLVVFKLEEDTYSRGDKVFETVHRISDLTIISCIPIVHCMLTYNAAHLQLFRARVFWSGPSKRSSAVPIYAVPGEDFGMRSPRFREPKLARGNHVGRIGYQML